MTVGAAGLELVAEGGLVDEDVHDYREEDRDEDTGVYLRAGEELVETELCRGDAVIGRLIDIAGLRALDHVLEIADIEEPCDEVCRDPVRHNAGENLVYIQECLEQAGDRAPERTGEHTAEEGDEPDEECAHSLGRETESEHQRDHCAHEVLAGSTDVEQTRLVRDGDGETGHDERGRAEEHVADARGVEAPAQHAGGVTAGAEYTGEDKADAFPCALGGNALAGEADDEDDKAANDQTDKNGQQRRDDLLRGVLRVERGQLFFHTASPSLPARLAPAM